MQEVLEKIIEKLEERKVRDAGIALDKDQEERCFWYKQALNKAIEIVKQAVAEYNNGWIPASERLPEEYGCYLVMWESEEIKTGRLYYEIVEYEPKEGWIGAIPQAYNGEYEVVAWQPLPATYKQKGE